MGMAAAGTGVRHLADDAVVVVLLPIVAQLSLPLEVVDPRDVELAHRRHRVARVDVDRQLRRHQLALHRRELGAHEPDHVVDLADPLLVVPRQRLRVLAGVDRRERLLDVGGPVDLPDHQHARRREGKVPVDRWWVVGGDGGGMVVMVVV